MTVYRFASTARTALALVLLAAPAAPALAQPFSYQGWGPRVGVGDDHTVVSTTLPVHCHFPLDGPLHPYAGGGLLVSFIDRDHPRGRRDSSETDIGPLLAGGVEWRLAGGSTMFLELNLAGGAAP